MSIDETIVHGELRFIRGEMDLLQKILDERRPIEDVDVLSRMLNNHLFSLISALKKLEAEKRKV